MFYIAGDGPEKESIMKEIEKYGLQQRVKMGIFQSRMSL